jgi:hypothetical protein
MKKPILFLIASLFAIASSGQNFEGKIVYKNVYKSNLQGVTDDQLTSMIGSTQEYYIKGGDYKSVSNGSILQWQLYINKDNKVYNKMSNAESVLWNDGTENTDTVLKAVINKNAITILGYNCDELILTCNSGIQKYYFNAKLKVDVKLYINHKFGNWYYIISKANALPLKMEIENKQFSIESIASVISPMKLEKTFFDLPAGINTIKSPN